MRKNRTPFLSIVILFLLVNIIFLSARHFLDSKGFDRKVLITGNTILFLVTIFSFWLSKRSLASKNPHAFVRGVYGSIMIKLFVCIIAVLVYVFVAGDVLNKPALFTCMGLYLIYTAVEVSVLTRLLKEKKNV
jgi:hypothetical protein